jgi:hypothetical protein
MLYTKIPTDYHANVNTSMTSHTYAMTTLKPVVSASHEETTLGPIGMEWRALFIMIEKVEM